MFALKYVIWSSDIHSRWKSTWCAGLLTVLLESGTRMHIPQCDMNSHSLTHTHTHSLTLSHTQTHTHTHIYALTHLYTYIHVHHIYSHTCTCSYACEVVRRVPVQYQETAAKEIPRNSVTGTATSWIYRTLVPHCISTYVHVEQITYWCSS